MVELEDGLAGDLGLDLVERRRSSAGARAKRAPVDHPLPAPDALDPPLANRRLRRSRRRRRRAPAAARHRRRRALGRVSDRVELAAQEHVLAPHAADAARGSQSPRPSPRRSCPRSKTVVLVLNGNGRTGAAAAAASRVTARGYRIGAVANAPRQRLARSIVMYRPGFAGEGSASGKDLGVKLVDAARRHARGPARARARRLHPRPS